MSIPSPKKSLGQNFLQDPNIARKIVRALGVRPDDLVVEIGPGPGALTRHLVEECPAGLWLVEKDDHWAAEHVAGLCRPMAGPYEGFPTRRTGCAVVRADALALPWESLPPGTRCIGNLPYNVASPLMWEVFSRARSLARAVFMIQKEVGQRLIAQPGTRAYGALSVWVQSFVRPKMEFIVPPGVFYPKPKVDSAVLSFAPLDGGPGDFDPVDLAAAVKACFQMRRKQLGTIVKAHGKPVELLDNLYISPARRPESLSVREFQFLSRCRIFSG